MDNPLQFKNTKKILIVFLTISLFLNFFINYNISLAAGLKPRSAVSKQSAYNPTPAQDDIILPMPCDLQMIFKLVAIPTQGFLWDLDIILGCDNCDRPEMEYYDRRFYNSISGPFCPADLPQEWAEHVPQHSGIRYNFYLMGKYEVSTLQYKAIMNDSCPSAIIEKDLKPMSSISWYDAIEFSRKYNAWLIQNAIESIPRFDNDPKNIGYLRLPTEAEWEFAARGGNNVPRDSLRQNDFHPLAEGKSMSDYAAYRPENTSRILENPENIGSRQANPLGIHDMSGNVAEMMLEPFQFSLGGRQHGSAGGYLRKGGSFNSSENEIKPGRREEIPFFHARGESKTKDTGFRLVISGINTPDGGRTNILKNEWEKIGAQNNVFSESANPLEEIDRILDHTQNSAEKENLGKLRNVIKDYNISLKREQNAAADNALRATVYMLENIRNMDLRKRTAKDDYTRYSKILATIEDKTSQTYLNAQKILTEIQKISKKWEDGVNLSLNFYREQLDILNKLPDEMFKYHLNILKHEFSQNGIFNRNMLENTIKIEKHLSYLKNNQRKNLQKDVLLKDVLTQKR